MKKLFLACVLIIIFLAGCISKPVSGILFLKQSSILTIESYNSKAIGISENQFVASTNKLEIDEIVMLIAESKDLKLNNNKIKDLSKENSYYITFKILNGNNAGEYSYSYFPEERILLLSDTKKITAVSVEGQLKAKFDNFIKNQVSAMTKQAAPKGIAPTSFITWMETEKWAEVNGKNMGVYEMINIKNSKHRLFLISLGEQKYGTRLQGEFFNSPDSANLVVNVTPFYPNNEVKELKSFPYLILRTTKEQNIVVRWVDGTGEVKEVIKQYDTDFYDPIAETYINN